MADLQKIIEEVASGLLTGGASMITTIFAVFQDVKKRVVTLEERLGSQDPKTGIYLALGVVEDTTKKLRKEMDSWNDDPPDWAKRLLSRARSTSNHDLSGQLEFESRIERTVKDFRDRIKRLEDEIDERIERIENETQRQSRSDVFLMKDDYTRDSQARAEEMLKVREQLATANGLLRGVMSALDFVEAEKPKFPGKFPGKR